MTIDFKDFSNIDIRVGLVTKAENFPEARKPAIKVWVDFGTKIGELKSSAQITQHYDLNSIIGRQVLAVTNFSPRQIGNFMSEVLLLGVPDENGDVVLIKPDKSVPIGGRLY
jgi:tRNA-binding protein